MSQYNMLVSRKKLEYIAHNVIITNHAEERIAERLGYNVNICKLMLNSPFWFRNTDETINIAIDQERYFVVKEDNGKFLLITIKEPSLRGFDVTDKFVIAYMGLDREDGISKTKKG